MSHTDEAWPAFAAGRPGAPLSGSGWSGGVRNGPWAEIEAIVKQAEPRVLFVEPRILRRVILQDLRLPGIGFTVPHGHVYTIERERLLVIVDRAELNISPAADLPLHVILLPHPPEDQPLTDENRTFVLWQFWRHVFHGRVHAELAERCQREEWTEADVYERIRRLGAAPFFEVRQVLRRDELLQHDRNRTAAFLEFAAVVLELRYFAPTERPHYFPAIEDWSAVDALFDADFPHPQWHAQTRPAGAPQTCPQVPPPPRPAGLEAVAGLAPGRDGQPIRASLAHAAQASERGNQVKGAILHHLSGDEAGAQAELRRLAERLARVCGDEPDAWQAALTPLLEHASTGYRSVEARLLYDLQKACIAQERGVFRFDLWGWITSGGKQPLRRPLQVLEQVHIAKHVRTAVHRLPHVRLLAEDRQRLTALLTQAEERTEEVLRTRIRPLITADLDAVGLVPTNLPEQVTRAKLIEELLDHIAERGFLNMGNLRDALSQNQLKLPDLGGLAELAVGDKLLRADRRLARSLEGVYRGGAVYLRGPQRLSSIAFGTPTGRFLVQYLVLPFGGAYVILEALKHVLTAVGVMGHGPAATLASRVPRAAVEGLMARTQGLEVAPAPSRTGWFDAVLTLLGGLRLFHLAVFLLGLFLLLLYHRPSFRRHVVLVLRTGWRWSRWLLVELPLKVIRARWVRWILESPAFAVARSYVFRPAVATFVLFTPAALTWHALWSPRLVLEVFLAVNLFLHSPAGRYLEERLLDVIVRTWHELRFRFLAVAFQWIMDAFQRLMQAVEQMIYHVDEWLRFQAGDPGRFVLLKVAVGLVWGVVSYIIRFAVTLLIEPQVNPIKHFPVVTVSHKILLPYTLWLKGQVQQVLGPGHEALSATIATTIILLVPGMIGFLVWELKENWRLYEMNRRPQLGPSRIGPHGETLTRLLRPGFHSGTLPKQFARLRQALHADPQDALNLASHKHLAAIEATGVSLRRFVDRELCALLRWTGFDDEAPLHVGRVRLATQRVELTVESSRPGEAPIVLVFEDRGGVLCAEVRERGWLSLRSAAEQRRFADALTGLYHLGGVELLSGELQQRLPDGVLWECTRDELLVSDAPDRAARYRLEEPDSAWLIPRDPEGRRLEDWPTLPADRLLLIRQSLTWAEWVEYWRTAGTSDSAPLAPAAAPPVASSAAVDG